MQAGSSPASSPFLMGFPEVAAEEEVSSSTTPAVKQLDLLLYRIKHHIHSVDCAESMFHLPMAEAENRRLR